MRALAYKNGNLFSPRVIYGDNLKITIERESEEMYRRKKLDGEFTFLNEDFDTIYNSSLDDEFRIVLLNGEGDSEYVVATGIFHKANCTFDVDNKICTTSVLRADEYDKLLNGMNDKYDLIKLAPPRESVTMLKRPIIQIYMLGDTKLTNLLGNISYEVSAKEVTDASEMASLYKFAPIAHYRLIRISGMPSSLSDLNGYYWGEAPITDTEGTTYFHHISRGYKIAQIISLVQGAYRASYLPLTENDSPISYNGNVVIGGTTTGTDPDELSWGYAVGAQFTQLGDTSVVQRRYTYARMVYDNPNVATPAIRWDIPAEDIVDNNLNFHYCSPVSSATLLGFKERLIYSFQKQSTPTKWGIDGEGMYFVQPIRRVDGTLISSSDNVIPIGFNVWSPMSFWFDSDETIASRIYPFNSDFVMKDAISLGNAIKYIVAQIDNTIRVELNANTSQFLFNAINPISQMAMRLFITPITNIKKTYYNNPARKGELSLRQLLDMLKGCFQCYWHIELEVHEEFFIKRLRIEHIKWYKNGGSYDANISPLLRDLTTMSAPKLGKPWSFGQNSLSYDTSKLVKRYEFSWGDSSTEPFKGYAIDIKNAFCEQGQTKNTTIDNFLSDLDFIMGAPNAVGDDMFALIATRFTDNANRTWIEDCQVASNTPTFSLQNGALSFIALANRYAKSFWKYNLAGDSAYMQSPYFTPSGWEEGVYLQVDDTMRIRKQKVTFPYTLNTYGNEGLIKTDIGSGEWVKMTIDLSSECAEAELIFDTE